MKWVVGLKWKPGFETQLSTHLCWVSHSVSLSFGFLLWKTVVLMPTFPTSTKRSRGSVWKCVWRRPVSYKALWRPSPPLCCTLPWLTASVTSMEPSVWRACITNLCLFSDKYTSQVAQWVKNLPAMQETQEMQVRSLGWEDPLEEGMATLCTVLAWRIPMDRGAWSVTDHSVTKSQRPLKRLSTHKCFYGYKKY